MILGIGIDTVSITRVQNLMSKYDNKFANKVFSAKEIDRFNQITSDNAKKSYYAKRFAAKEAFSKALGLGIGRGIDFKDIEIGNDKLGKPFINILNDKEHFIKQHFKVEHYAIHLSLSDDADSALAMVTISSL